MALPFGPGDSQNDWRSSDSHASSDHDDTPMSFFTSPTRDSNSHNSHYHSNNNSNSNNTSSNNNVRSNRHSLQAQSSPIAAPGPPSTSAGFAAGSGTGDAMSRVNLHRRFTTNALPTLNSNILNAGVLNNNSLNSSTLKSSLLNSNVFFNHTLNSSTGMDASNSFGLVPVPVSNMGFLSVTEPTLPNIPFALEKKRAEYDYLKKKREKFQQEMELLEQQARRGEEEIMNLTNDVGQYETGAGYKSEPTTPPEYRDAGFPTSLSRPNRFSASSLMSAPGAVPVNRIGRANSQGLSSPSERARAYQALTGMPSPGSIYPGTPGELEENERRDETAFSFSHRSAAAQNRNSMPVTRRDHGIENLVSADPSQELGSVDTTGYLFGEKETGRGEIPTPAAGGSGYLSMQTNQDRFPVLVGRARENSQKHKSASDVLDLASSSEQSGPSGWPTFSNASEEPRTRLPAPSSTGYTLPSRTAHPNRHSMGSRIGSYPTESQRGRVLPTPPEIPSATPSAEQTPRMQAAISPTIVPSIGPIGPPANPAISRQSSYQHQPSSVSAESRASLSEIPIQELDVDKRPSTDDSTQDFNTWRAELLARRESAENNSAAVTSTLAGTAGRSGPTYPGSHANLGSSFNTPFRRGEGSNVTSPGATNANPSPNNTTGLNTPDELMAQMNNLALDIQAMTSKEIARSNEQPFTNTFHPNRPSSNSTATNASFSSTQGPLPQGFTQAAFPTAVPTATGFLPPQGNITMGAHNANMGSFPMMHTTSHPFTGNLNPQNPAFGVNSHQVPIPGPLGNTLTSPTAGILSLPRLQPTNTEIRGPWDTAQVHPGAADHYRGRRSDVEYIQAPPGRRHWAENLMGAEERANLAEFINSPSMTLELMKDYLYYFCKDQYGCRWLQNQLHKNVQKDIDLVFDQTKDHMVDLMTDPFGNYTCQKLFKHATVEQRTYLMRNAAPHMVHIAVNQHGTRALQTLIEYVETDEQVKIIRDGIKNHVVLLVQDTNGNHVIQKCLIHLRDHNRRFIIDSVCEHLVVCATHRHGCCVVQRCVKYGDWQQKAQLVSCINVNWRSLINDQYGNYVLQNIQDQNEPAYSHPLADLLIGNIGKLARHKQASNVVEKAIRTCHENTKHSIIQELVNVPDFDQLLADQFANYVIQTAFDQSGEEDAIQIAARIRAVLPRHRTMRHGRRLSIRLLDHDKKFGFVPQNATMPAPHPCQREEVILEAIGVAPLRVDPSTGLMYGGHSTNNNTAGSTNVDLKMFTAGAGPFPASNANIATTSATVPPLGSAAMASSGITGVHNKGLMQFDNSLPSSNAQNTPGPSNGTHEGSENPANWQ